MSKNFSDMSVDEQAALVQNVAQTAKDCEIDMSVSLYREEVCQLT
jgi:hypothetical protein